MTWTWVTSKRATFARKQRRIALRNGGRRVAQLLRPSVAVLVSLFLAGGPLSPVFAQEQGQQQTPPQKPGQEHPSLPTPQTPAQQAYTPSLTKPPIPVSLGVSKYNYSKAPRAFPNIINPYRAKPVPPPVLTNAPRIEQLIRDNKLELTLQDAVELALENSPDIALQRYVPWIAELSVLRAKTGATGFQVAGAVLPFSTANINPLTFFPISFDPIVTSSVFIDSRTSPINNPFLSGTGAAAAAAASLKSHTTTFSNQYTQGFTSGATATVAWTNSRSSSSSAFNFFNPAINSSLVVTVTQQLLNGAGHFVNTRHLQIAKNNRKIADAVFEQQTITTVTNTTNAYWELVYARQAVLVQQQAVAVSEKLYNDNKKQLEIGTMAPLDVTRAEAQLATDRQNLINAQTVQLQDQQTLKNAISKDPLAANIINVEIVPIDRPTPPETVEAPTFEDAVREAFEKRPDLRQQGLNVLNAGIDVRANKNALLPSASISAQYGSFGLAGNSVLRGDTVISSSGLPIVDSAGNPVLVNGVPIFQPATSRPDIGTAQQGFTTANSQIFRNQFPDYNITFNLQVPLRNRSAYASDQHARLFERQQQEQLQQLKNAAVLDVRTTYIALVQDRAQVEAATKARQLQQQTFDAEQKKYQLGASTVYQVILTQRDLVTAQGAELRALANLLEAKANYERAVGRTLDVNRVTIADATGGEVQRETLIPGTLHGKVVGTEELFNKVEQGGQR